MRFEPSPYTLSFSELQIDGAYMLWWAEYASSRRLWIYPKVDASPQAGCELLASEVDVIDDDALVDAARAVERLEWHPWKGTYSKHPNQDPLCRERAALGRVIVNSVVRHMRPLQVMSMKKWRCHSRSLRGCVEQGMNTHQMMHWRTICRTLLYFAQTRGRSRASAIILTRICLTCCRRGIAQDA